MKTELSPDPPALPPACPDCTSLFFGYTAWGTLTRTLFAFLWMLPTHRERFILEKLTRYYLTNPLIFDLSRVYRNPAGERQPYSHLHAVQRSTKRLMDSGYITAQKLRCFHNALCYRLTRKGARFILPADEYEREKRSKILFAGFRISNEAHNLATSLIAVKMEIDADRAGLALPLFVRDGDLVSDVLLDGRKRRLIPDGSVVLIGGEGRSQLFFLEIDLSTETRSTFAEKIRKYLDFDTRYPTIPLSDGARQYPCRSFRVLTFCKSRERLYHLLAVVQRVAPRRKWRMFHFLALDQLIQEQALSARNSLAEASILTDLSFATPKHAATLYGKI